MEQFYDLSNKFHTLSYFIGKIDYVPAEAIEAYLNDGVDILGFQDNVNFAQVLLTKRIAFSYEEEVRLLFCRPSTNEIDLAAVKNSWDDSDFFFVNIDPNALFDEVEIDPWIKGDKYLNLCEEIKAAGYEGSITRSELYDKPFFNVKINSR